MTHQFSTSNFSFVSRGYVVLLRDDIPWVVVWESINMISQILPTPHVREMHQNTSYCVLLVRVGPTSDSSSGVQLVCCLSGIESNISM